MSSETEIRPFRVEMPEEAVADLWRRIAAARLPSKELVDDRSQGVQLATIQELARYYKISRAFTGGQPSGGLTRDHILDNITLYWLTGTGASAARSYWENGRAQTLAAGQPPPPVKLPVGFTTFPGEIFRAPRSWVEASYPTLTYFNEADKGGHFAAWEEPELFSEEVRAAFRSLR